MHVFLTGATGLIGRTLCGALLGRGHFVTALSRSEEAPRRLPIGVRHVTGDPVAPGPWLDALGATDAVIHLAGEPVAEGRWTEERKRRIGESRIASTRLVAERVARGGPKILLSGSAVGVYGSRGDEVLDESSAPGEGFLADVSRRWEAAAEPARARARLVSLRTGIVLARDGGALPRMVLPFRLFAGGPLGRGDFWQPWIHLADEIGLVLLALEDERVEGALHLTAPEPVRNRDLARAIGRVLRRPSFVPAPEAALRLALGEMADAVLSSQRALPRKAQALGYQFKFPSVESALQDLIG
ncbi:MAG TPA: TIGR01777 family oxidoreductase [Anaeromyxobacteraceae bacterium]|nr:TIGR01777 family oxidoreductase [Anaeromyxobacteraceae bacterium]